MGYYRVAFTVHGTTWGYVEASSPEDAAEKALQLEDRSLPLCWQCARLADSAQTGPFESESIEKLVDPDEIAEAQEFVEAGGWW